MSFRFRFESLLHLYRLRRDEVGAELGKANEAIQKIDEQVQALLSERAAAVGRASESRVGSISVDTMLAHGRYDSILQADLRSLGQTRAELEQELARRHQKLVAAEADVKRYERLEAQHRDAYRQQWQRRQQSEADEAAAIQFSMKRRKR